MPGDDFKTSYGLPTDPGKYCIVVNYVVFEAKKIKFKPTTTVSQGCCLLGSQTNHVFVYKQMEVVSYHNWSEFVYIDSWGFVVLGLLKD